MKTKINATLKEMSEKLNEIYEQLDLIDTNLSETYWKTTKSSDKEDCYEDYGYCRDYCFDALRTIDIARTQVDKIRHYYNKLPF